MSDQTLQGGCHCGRIRYRITGPVRDAGYCHCRDCQITSGGPVQVWMDTDRDQLEILAGEPKVYESSKHGRRLFCAECGSQLFFTSTAAPESIFPNVGTLDDPSAVIPHSHIWTRSQIEWFKVEDDLDRFEQDPPG